MFGRDEKGERCRERDGYPYTEIKPVCSLTSAATAESSRQVRFKRGLPSDGLWVPVLRRYSRLAWRLIPGIVGYVPRIVGYAATCGLSSDGWERVALKAGMFWGRSHARTLLEVRMGSIEAGGVLG